jgi:hypothetical protein
VELHAKVAVVDPGTALNEPEVIAAPLKSLICHASTSCFVAVNENWILKGEPDVKV